MTLKYTLVEADEASSLTAFFNGKLFVADRTHAAWPQLKAAVASADEDTNLDELARLFDPSVAVEEYFNKVSERVSVAGGHVFLDHEEVSDSLANHIIRFMNENDQDRATALINFLEKIATNPNEHSRSQLYAWLERRDFTITADGDFLAYKGVRSRSGGNDLDKYPYESISTGEALVDGKVYNGAIPNGVGAVVEMPRGKVQWDPDVACHTGLHAGNFRYANSFSQGALLTVKINPRDVVSVPHDSNSEKIRCCRYTVLEVNEQEQEYLTSYWNQVTDDDLDVDYSDEEHYDDDYDEYGDYRY